MYDLTLKLLYLDDTDTGNVTNIRNAMNKFGNTLFNFKLSISP